MVYGNTLRLLTTLAAVLATPGLARAQLGGLIRDAQDAVRSVQQTVEGARDLGCDVGGSCGVVQQSEFFQPNAYESLAVTVVDGSGRFSQPGATGVTRGAFEGKLIENGYLLAASADVEEVQARIGRGADGWSEEELAQLRDFVQGIDAVLAVEIENVEMGRCELNGRANTGTQVIVRMSARWLNVDAGDVPWVATHDASVCENPSGGAAIFTNALDRTSAQLATTLPMYGETEQ